MNYFSDNYVGSGAPVAPSGAPGGFAYTVATMSKSASGLVGTSTANTCVYNNAGTAGGAFPNGGWFPLAATITLSVTIPASTGGSQGYFEFYYGSASASDNHPWLQLQLASGSLQLTAGCGLSTANTTFAHPGAGTYTLTLVSTATNVSAAMTGTTGAVTVAHAPTTTVALTKLWLQTDSAGPTYVSISVDGVSTTTPLWTDYINTFEVF